MNNNPYLNVLLLAALHIVSKSRLDEVNYSDSKYSV